MFYWNYAGIKMDRQTERMKNANTTVFRMNSQRENKERLDIVGSKMKEQCNVHII